MSAKMFEKECPDCGEIILWCYERSVYDGEIQCPCCALFIEVD
jgi:uncharacterized Zn finger protein (UPF0148 family)